MSLQVIVQNEPYLNFILCCIVLLNSVSRVTDLGAGREGFGSRQSQGLLFTTASRQLPIQWVPGALSRGKAAEV